jgi:hypothetical protein
VAISVVIDEERDIERVTSGWRLEENSNSYWRWRWQKKDAMGKPLTYLATSGNVAYKRGSKYVKI